MSRLIGWRHARIIILAEPVEFISGDVKGYAYDAGKDDKKGLIAMYEEFRASPLNRYLPIGDFTGKLSVDQINAYGKYMLPVFHLGYPLSSSKSGDC